MTDTITLPRELTDEMAEAIAFNAHCCGGMAYDTWEAIVAAAPVNEGWIKCSDRLPEDTNDVTIFSPDTGVCNGYYWQSTDEFHSCNGDNPNGPVQGVTHWRPLPAPPAAPLDH